MEQSVKRPWQSKTLVINGVLGLVAFLSLVVPGAHVVADFIGGHGAEIAMAWSLLNVILRAVTKDAIVLGE